MDYDQDGNTLTTPIINGDAHPALASDLNAAARPDTTWILERSTDLVTCEEIYPFEGIPMSIDRTDTRVTITDEATPADRAYNRFRANLEPSNLGVRVISCLGASGITVRCIQGTGE